MCVKVPLPTKRVGQSKTIVLQIWGMPLIFNSQFELWHSLETLNELQFKIIYENDIRNKIGFLMSF